MTIKKITNFAIDIDEGSLEQFNNCCKEDFVVKAALMADTHRGYVAPIGAVIVTKDYIVPSWVGYDIGCGMIAVKFSEKDILDKVKKFDFDIFDRVNLEIPMGKGKIGKHNDVSLEIKEKFKDIVGRFKYGVHDKKIFNLLNTQALAHLGSLGSGNHFIELGYDNINKNSNEVWVIIHSGSRGIGHKLATHSMKMAAKGDIKFEKTYPLEVNSIEGKEYLNILDFGLEFALLNRLEMAYRVRDVLRKVLDDKSLDFELWVNKNHNHAVFENGYYIHRKGATPAKSSERGIIPGNMKDGSYLVEGLGNKEFLESSSHGAGRVLSRKQAKEKLSVKDFKEMMKGILSKANERTLDESPQAYKNIDDVMKAQEKSVKIVGKIVPLINWKG